MGSIPDEGAQGGYRIGAIMSGFQPEDTGSIPVTRSMFLSFIHQYAYFFSLVLGILPITLLIDSRMHFFVLRKILTKKGLLYVLLSILFWSAYDLLWIRKLGFFPPDRILFFVLGVPIEEMLVFAFGFYNVLTVFAYVKMKVKKMYA